MQLRRQELQLFCAQAEREYPHECCGVIIGKPGSVQADQVYPCTNIQDKLHRQDPKAYPRDARTAYQIDPAELLNILREAERNGLALKVIVHSHIDAGAYFSAEDKRVSTWHGEPLYPHTVYVVMSVISGVLHEVKAFRWDPARNDFGEEPLEIL